MFKGCPFSQHIVPRSTIRQMKLKETTDRKRGGGGYRGGHRGHRGRGGPVSNPNFLATLEAIANCMPLQIGLQRPVHCAIRYWQNLLVVRGVEQDGKLS